MSSTSSVTWKGRGGPLLLQTGPQTFHPTTVSRMLADALEVASGEVVLDVGCGTGVLAILAARLGAARVVGVDAAPDTTEVASSNAAAHGVASQASFFEGDLFEPLPSGFVADVIIGDVSGIPDDLASVSGWFPPGPAGGPSGAELPLRLLEAAPRYLASNGRLYLPTGSLQAEDRIFEAADRLFDRRSLALERRIPLPAALAEDPVTQKLAADGVVSLESRGSRYLWTARVWILEL